MVRSQLAQTIKAEIEHYLNIPYAINKLKNGHIVEEVPYGAKGNWLQIKNITKKITKKEKIDLSKPSSQQLYNFRKKHKIGIDCSGLAYHLLDKTYQLLFNQSIKFKLVGTNNKKGVRRLSANMLTNPINSMPILKYENIQTADLIRFNQAKHVIFIVEKKDNIITYVHNSRYTQKRGVHYGQIKITNPQKSLNFQQWSDTHLNGQPYSQFFFPNSGDGIFRLKCLTNL
ncbi:hypothetical protein DRH14_01515 [Candidatus Shapirobacteria bacterium]|nr:MAG: hypothetical protein DRH14_01515 [Candidatus Shapirobacteria bacterium]